MPGYEITRETVEASEPHYGAERQKWRMDPRFAPGLLEKAGVNVPQEVLNWPVNAKFREKVMSEAGVKSSVTELTPTVGTPWANPKYRGVVL